MNLLVDSHILLWWLGENPRLPKEIRRAISNADSVMVSAATVWELAIKSSLGKLDVPDDLEKQMEAHRFRELSVTIKHGLAAAKLPRHHGDPFDRMLVAQAIAEGLTLVTNDDDLRAYRVPILFA